MTKKNPPAYEAAPTPDRQAHNRLGDLLVREGLLTPDGLKKALHFQRTADSYRPLGKVCVDLRLISKQDMQRFLRKHQKSISLGEMLLNMGLITREQLNLVLEQQRLTTMRFGALLINGKIITEAQLAEALSLQLDLPRIIPSPELIDQSLLEGLNPDELRELEFIPVHRYENQLVVVMSDPLNGEVMQRLVDQFKCRIMPAIATSSEILAAISALFDQKHLNNSALQLDGELLSLTHQTKFSEEKVMPIAQFLIRSAVEEDASAMHVESHENYLRVRFRKQGVLVHRTDLPQRLGPSLTQCIKAPFRLKWEQYWEEHIAVNIGNRRVELSISFFEGQWGENIVVHILHPTQEMLSFENLGFSPLTLARCQSMLDRAGGLMLVGSPVRSGKSTLLYAFLNHLAQNNLSILTLEESVEQKLPGVIQHRYKSDSKDTPEAMIGAMMDYDSDVFMVSRVSTQAVAQAINRAALVGKKVFAGLAANDVASVLFRLMEIEARSLLATPVSFSILTQKLVRKLCDACRTAYSPTEPELLALGINAIDRTAVQFYKPVGCAKCNHSGYQGMTALHESLRVNEPIRQALLQGQTASSVRKLAREQAFLVSMVEDGIYKVIQGLTSLEEIARVVMVYESEALLQRSLYEIHSICHGKVKEYL